MTRTQRLLAASIIGIIVVILAGAVVRASGSGLGCPHWPACFEESFFPPLSAEGIPEAYRNSDHVNLQKTWTEWINRLIGFLAGLVILGTTISAWMELRDQGGNRIALLITAAGFLTAFQGWQGAMVVKYHLDPRFVTVHLMTALLILGMLIQSWILLRSVPGGFEHGAERHRVHGLSRALLALALGQFLVGALLRGTLEIVADENPLLTRGAWIGEVGAIDWVHRGLAFLLMAGVVLVGLRIRSLGARDALLGRAVGCAKLIVMVQVATGLILIEWDLRPAVQVIHIVLGTLLMTALFLQERLLRRD